jgi:hypothetical protein
LSGHTAPFVPLVMKKRGNEIGYEAKTGMLAGRRYIVCRNRQEAEKDAADRASIRRTGAPSCQGRQGAGRQHRLSPLLEDDQPRSLRGRPR